MRGLPAVPSSASHRTRRWDAVIIGGALPGLVAGIVLAMRGARILMIEEDAAASGFAGLREPFFTTGAEKGSVLGACLRALLLPPRLCSYPVDGYMRPRRVALKCRHLRPELARRTW